MQKWFPAYRCAMVCLLKAAASANCYSPAPAILLSINTPIIRKSPHVNWNTRHVCLLHGQPGSLNSLENPGWCWTQGKSFNQSVAVPTQGFGAACDMGYIMLAHWGLEDLLHWKAKVSFPFIQGEKSTRRTSPVSDPFSCISVIPAFYVTAIFLFTFD